jgi:rRNA-processing protein FCF1
MSQIKIFGLREQLDPIKQQLSDVIHSCVVEALQYPADKRAQKECGIAPQDLEITIFETPKHNWGFRGLPGDEH